MGGKGIVAHVGSHFRGGPQAGQIQPAQPGDLAIPAGVERVPLVAVQQAIALVHFDQALHGELDVGPKLLEPYAVGGHLILAIRPKDTASLTVHGQAKSFAAVPDGARRFFDGDSEVGALPHIALEIGKQAGHGVGIVPDVRAGALTAADAFPTPEASCGKTVRGRSSPDRPY